MKIKKVLRVLLVLAIVGGTAVAMHYYRQRHGGSGNASDVLRVSGNIEVTDADVSFKIGGRVEARPVDEGEMVQAGQLVARLESRDLAADVALRLAELAAAKAGLDELNAGSRPEEIGQAEAAAAAAKARLDELLAGSRPQEIAAAEAVLRQAQAEADRRRVEYDRLVKLRQQSQATDIEFEVARAAFESAKAVVVQADERFKLIKEGPRKEQIAQARPALAEAEQKMTMVRNGPRKEDIEQAKARGVQADAALELARTRLGYATLNAPLAGVVLSKNIEPGEYVAPGTPVITVGDLVHVWVRAYVDETDLGRVKFGQSARVTTDTYPGKVYPGRVAFISSQAEFTPKNVQTEKERVKLVYRIKIDIDNPNLELKPGMPADAEISLVSPQ